jgi:pullulanase
MLVNHANEDKWKTILIIFNGNRQAIPFKLANQTQWRVVARDTAINPDSSEYISGAEIEVPAISMMMLVEDYFNHNIQFSDI